MENPSLRVSGHVSSMNRTFIVEDHAEDEFGQWAKDEVTGEQGYVDDERLCFWTWDDTECAWQSRPFKGRQAKRRKRKGKRKRRSKRTGRAFSGDEQARSRMVVRRGLCLVVQRKERQEGLSKGNDGFHKGGFRPYQPDKGAGKDFPKQRQRERIEKEKAKKEPILNPDSQPQKHPMKKDMARPGNQTIGLPVIGLMIPGLQMLGGSVQRLILHGWWQPH